MRNLLQFIWNNQFTLLFLFLEVLGFFILGSNNSYQNSRLQAFSVKVSGGVADVQRSYSQYIGLVEENEELQEENSVLREMLNKRIHRSIPSEIDVIEYETIPGNVISSSHDRGNNYMILDRGLVNGIEAEQGVLSSTGVAGIVTSVSHNYAAIMPLIHSQALISCKLKKNDYFGIGKWDGKDYRIGLLEDIPNHAQIFPGDTIVTRGASGFFPPDQILGFVKSSEQDESSGFQTIKFVYATDFRKIESVYIIQNTMRNQLDSLIINQEDE